MTLAHALMSKIGGQGGSTGRRRRARSGARPWAKEAAELAKKLGPKPKGATTKADDAGAGDRLHLQERNQLLVLSSPRRRGARELAAQGHAKKRAGSGWRGDSRRGLEDYGSQPPDHPERMTPTSRSTCASRPQRTSLLSPLLRQLSPLLRQLSPLLRQLSPLLRQLSRR